MKKKKKAPQRRFKVWAIMDGQRWPVGIGYLGSTRKEVMEYEAQPWERVVQATLTLSSTKGERGKK